MTKCANRECKSKSKKKARWGRKYCLCQDCVEKMYHVEDDEGNVDEEHCKDPKNMTGKPIKKIKNKYSKVTHVFPLESYVWAPNDASEQDKDEILQTLKESKEKLREN